MDHLQGQQGSLLGLGLHSRGRIIFFILLKSSFTQLTQSWTPGNVLEHSLRWGIIGSATLIWEAAVMSWEVSYTLEDLWCFPRLISGAFLSRTAMFHSIVSGRVKLPTTREDGWVEMSLGVYNPLNSVLCGLPSPPTDQDCVLIT